jgi:hypothetical protein
MVLVMSIDFLVFDRGDGGYGGGVGGCAVAK